MSDGQLMKQETIVHSTPFMMKIRQFLAKAKLKLLSINCLNDFFLKKWHCKSSHCNSRDKQYLTLNDFSKASGTKANFEDFAYRLKQFHYLRTRRRF